MPSSHEKVLIVSAANEKYHSLISGLILSIKDQKPDVSFEIGVLDVGLTPPQTEELRAQGATVVPGEWDFDFPARQEAPRWFQAMTARCHIPRYFPGFDIYIWLDADLWLQDWRAIDLLVRAARQNLLAVVPELHPAYVGMYTRGDFTIEDQRVQRDLYKSAYGQHMADRLMLIPTLNSGVFALRGESPAWKIWRKWMEPALTSKVHKIIEQNALNAAVYSGQIPYHPLPSWCNWICGQAPPRFDSATRKFVEPALPYDPISVLHVTPRTRAHCDIQTLDGKTVPLPMDYIPFRAAVSPA
jgi:hypothetical protein